MEGVKREGGDGSRVRDRGGQVTAVQACRAGAWGGA